MSGGGAIYVTDSSKTVVTNVTMFANSAEGAFERGGAVWINSEDVDLRVRNSISWDNIAPETDPEFHFAAAGRVQIMNSIVKGVCVCGPCRART